MITPEQRETIKSLLSLVCEFLPPCSGNCGRPATRSTKCSCPMGLSYYCDNCNIPLTKLATFSGWDELPWATIIRQTLRLVENNES